ncbi:MAG: rhomboid family intramembrane serine protease [Limisphaerales bacterium]
MAEIAPATIAILAVTTLATLYAFRRPDIKERWIFNPQAILADKQFDRMITSGFIHADWMHFGFNAFSFYSFGRNIEEVYGAWTLVLVYGSSILGGSLLSLAIHRNHDYRALGASGGVCGVIFASIFLLPGSSITMFPLPIGIPAWLYAILFLVGSFVAHRKQSDNIGHDAHLGGAIVGLLLSAAMYPELIFAAPWMFAGVLSLSLAILMVLIFDPAHLLDHRLNSSRFTPGSGRSREYNENRGRNQKRAEIDRLLDKVSQKGIGKLSSSERKKLDELSKEVYGRK